MTDEINSNRTRNCCISYDDNVANYINSDENHINPNGINDM